MPPQVRLLVGVTSGPFTEPSPTRTFTKTLSNTVVPDPPPAPLILVHVMEKVVSVVSAPVEIPPAFEVDWPFLGKPENPILFIILVISAIAFIKAEKLIKFPQRRER